MVKKEGTSCKVDTVHSIRAESGKAGITVGANRGIDIEVREANFNRRFLVEDMFVPSIKIAQQEAKGNVLGSLFGL